LVVISLRPNIASRANAVASFLKDNASVPLFSFITCSTDFNLGGVLKGTGGMLNEGGVEGETHWFCVFVSEVDVSVEDDKTMVSPL